MTTPVHHHVKQWHKLLGNVSGWLDKAEQHAKAKGFEPENYLTLRLAPDMFTFARQIQSACDAAKGGASRLAGQDPPVHPDDEKTFADLRARVTKVTAHLESFKPADFDGAEERKIVLPFFEGKHMTGADYLSDLVVPNFFFHLTMTFALLRHAGVDLGKRDYLGALSLRAT